MLSVLPAAAAVHPADAGDAANDAAGDATEFVYRVDDPDPGEWTLRVTPENTVGFSYDLTRDESSVESAETTDEETAGTEAAE